MIEEILNEATAKEDDIPSENIEDIKESVPSESELKISELNEKIADLTQELEAYKQAKERQDRIAEQLNEFSELFPNVTPSAVPAEVWESVKKGNSLAAAYAIYEKRTTEAARRIEEINARNAKTSAGSVGKNSSEEFFSADEVRKMSPAEVRANFAKIRKSMETWK